MGKTKDKIRQIIKDSYDTNTRYVGWSGMHDAATNMIMKIIKKKVKKNEKRS